ncbi:hypothetical protein ACFQVC_24515 [Streptomyces monticola]|uniref:Uncharacterized protein n=1 Tax=Streptomyces monticola TaxID=2666263 RepID=A0ABW2JNK9_9ACTN
MRNRRIAARVVLGAALIAVPFALHSAGLPVSFFTTVWIVPGLLVLVFLLLRLSHGHRLKVCERVLGTYPL